MSENLGSTPTSETPATEQKVETNPQTTVAAEVSMWNPVGDERLYEAMWVVDAGAARDHLGKVLDGLKEVVEKGGGRWVNGDKWEERRLCYAINKKKRGLYILSHFACSPTAVARVDRQARLSELVLRHLITQDQDGLSIVPPARVPDDSREIGGFGGFGGEKRFGGGRQGGRRFFGNRERGERGDRGDRGDRGERRERRRGGDEGGRE